MSYWIMALKVQWSCLSVKDPVTLAVPWGHVHAGVGWCTAGDSSDKGIVWIFGGYHRLKLCLRVWFSRRFYNLGDLYLHIVTRDTNTPKSYNIPKCIKYNLFHLPTHWFVASTPRCTHDRKHVWISGSRMFGCWLKELEIQVGSLDQIQYNLWYSLMLVWQEWTHTDDDYCVSCFFLFFFNRMPN